MQTTLRTNPVKILKDRVRQIKPSLTKKVLGRDVKLIVIEKYPEYNTLEGGDLLKNVLALRTADFRLTEILEQIAAEHQASLNGEGGTQAT